MRKHPLIRVQEKFHKITMNMSHIVFSKEAFAECHGSVEPHSFDEATAVFCQKHWQVIKRDTRLSQSDTPAATTNEKQASTATKNPPPFTSAEIDGTFVLTNPWVDKDFRESSGTDKTWRAAQVDSDKVDNLIGISREKG